MGTSKEFEACLPFILKEEGGYSNTPGDHGGATNFGIIQVNYNIYRHTNGLPLQSVKLISAQEYHAIYWENYWQPNCPKLPAGLNLSVFNINVNGGSGRGTRILQQCLHIDVDGVWGPATDKAVTTISNLRALIMAFHDNERNFYQSILSHDRSQLKFASDWFGRNDRCERASLALAGTV